MNYKNVANIELKKIIDICKKEKMKIESKKMS